MLGNGVDVAAGWGRDSPEAPVARGGDEGFVIDEGVEVRVNEVCARVGEVEEFAL